MRLRKCAGGVVFFEDKVLLLQNDKGDWLLPKGVIREGKHAHEVALERVKHEAGVDANIMAPAGETRYEFFSQSRRIPVSNMIDWFIMKVEEDSFEVNAADGFVSGGFYEIDEALKKITYSSDKSLVSLSYDKYMTLRNG